MRMQMRLYPLVRFLDLTEQERQWFFSLSRNTLFLSPEINDAPCSNAEICWNALKCSQ